MENQYELRAGRVLFSEKLSGAETQFNYSKKVKKAIRKMGDLIENFYYLNHFSDRNLAPPYCTYDYISEQENYRMRLEKIAKEPNAWPLPYFFVVNKKVPQMPTYTTCDEYLVELKNEPESYSLFLAFKLRNLPLFEIHDCLNYHLSQNETKFLKYYKHSFLEYDFLFNKKQKTIIKEWIKEKANHLTEKKEKKKKDIPLFDEKEIRSKIEKHLSIINRPNLKHEPIFKNGDYEYLSELTYHLILNKNLPAISHKINVNGVSAAALRYLFYLIHKDLFQRESGTKKIFITFLHAVFQSFENQKSTTTSKKFAEKPKNFPL